MGDLGGGFGGPGQRKQNVRGVIFSWMAVVAPTCIAFSILQLLAGFHPTHLNTCACTLGCKVRLPPEVNRILYVRNLPYKITSDEMYDIFGKYGPIRQVRIGVKPETRGTVCCMRRMLFVAGRLRCFLFELRVEFPPGIA